MHLQRTKRNIFRGLLMLLAFLVVVIIGAQWMAKDAIAGFLKNELPSRIQLDYEDIEVNVLTGSAKLKMIALKVGTQDSLRDGTAKINALEVVGLGYWQFLVHQKITLRTLYIERPILTYGLKDKESDTTRRGKHPLGNVQALEVGSIKVVDGDVTLYKDQSDSVALKLDSVNIEISDVATDASRIVTKLPVTYSSLGFSGASLMADLGPYETLGVSKVEIKHGALVISDLALKSKYSKKELSWHLHKEHDFIDLKIPELSFENMELGYSENKYRLRTGIAVMKGPDLELYRDKLLPDDTERKKLYSEALRELPIQLDIPKIEISGGHIAYSERVNTETAPGKINFAEVSAQILHVQNIPGKKVKTSVEAKALLMNEAPITLNWSFDTQKKSDAFLASGTVKGFNPKNLNPFLESNLRVRARGDIQELYFTVSGDAVSSLGDMKMKYEDFEFSVLKKDRLRINKLLTAIGKVFVNDGSNTDENGYRYGGIEAQRDPTKSFFNYLWLNVSDGLTSTIIGNGKNERRKK
ncbi:hypothetical protein [Zobellia galactanivorans]|uniref:hypothetical protein n=1 Tax=Zobellia galactanivorans (strain DSM 12802 / CCUG 47099 / CIP 106680 / NCIMB 13871 / Dsij) TaxID=63186 RepID=UPI001C073D76|nr:hypothetical protein [Zobellia galactanivorans]MBU3027621.1 hypothetical protein [Zobellia galactanivorans]